MELNGRVIHTAILQEDFRKTDAVPSDTEDIVNMTLQVGGVEVALMLVELETGGVKISFRSRNPKRSIAANWPSNSKAADTRRRPARRSSSRWPSRRRKCLTPCARR